MNNIVPRHFKIVCNFRFKMKLNYLLAMTTFCRTEVKTWQKILFLQVLRCMLIEIDKSTQSYTVRNFEESITENYFVIIRTQSPTLYTPKVNHACII